MNSGMMARALQQQNLVARKSSTNANWDLIRQRSSDILLASSPTNKKSKHHRNTIGNFPAKSFTPKQSSFVGSLAANNSFISRDDSKVAN